MTEIEDEIIKLTKLFAFKIMTYTIAIEERLTAIICMSIAKKSSNIEKFVEYYDDVGLDKKIGLARIILQNDYPEILEKHSQIFTQIDELKKWRNLLAHINRYFVTDHMKNRSQFVIDGRKTSQQEELNEERMYKIMSRAEKCHNAITEIMIAIANKNGISEFYGIKNEPTVDRENSEPVS